MPDLSPSLRPADYVDPGVYDVEVERVFRRSWFPLCRVEQIADSGDRVALTLAGEPIVAVRGATGDVHVLSNVCPHRGSTIADEGSGNSSTLVCPYHRWVFRLDGSFVGAPLVEGTDLDGVCLRPIRHVIWEGFVLVDLSGEAPDVDATLAGLAAEIAPWRWSEQVVVGSRSFTSSWNWKIMVENYSECLHHLGVHRESLEPIQPARSTVIADNRGAPWVAMSVDTVDGHPDDPSEWIPDLAADRSRQLSVWTAFPLLMGGSNANNGFWVQLVPDTAAQHTVTWHLLVHRSHVHRYPPDRVERMLDDYEVVHREDMVICARVQAGLASGHLDRVRLAPLEVTVADFHRWVRGRLDTPTS